MYLLGPGCSLGPESDWLILEASTQSQLDPKPERMASDGGKSASDEHVLATCPYPWGFIFDVLPGDQLLGLS